MLVEKTVFKNFYCIRLDSGDDVLASLCEAVEKQGIKNAFILSGMGSTVNHHFHVVSTPDLPPENDFIKGDKPADIVNVNGLVINGRVHAHIIHSDDKIAYGGHLEPGVKVCTFMTVTMAEVDINLDKWDGMGNIKELLKK
jgi:predicted DNA-binding protein with PD1-like motif